MRSSGRCFTSTRTRHDPNTIDLWNSHGNGTEPWQIYHITLGTFSTVHFIEGFDTAGLKEAKATSPIYMGDFSSLIMVYTDAYEEW